MSPLATVETVISVLGLFFSKNPTVADVESLLPQVVTAISSAKSGSAFSVSFPTDAEGTSTVSWQPKTS